ncbi:Acg family FMN-binding oxidoreductase [Mangrovihabitans endophyticus]|uniref:Putative NAD(P)H nitroreductase n=1 Tax=Mangrovihabitans endophyticus TaxID=1751298 RepID=A0A8J3C548_9ACTN|nr:nitroreductase [Mangrovihabitans endophyticus]GGL19282.1 putative NAD(P)H nitroreductase [Mangrovihabitans endophyticus]
MTGHPRTAAEALLGVAARQSLRAPSVLNTQPWRWMIRGDTADLCAAPDRHPQVTDPDGRLLMLALGAALHHAEVTVRSSGWRTAVDRFPEAIAAQAAATQAAEPDEPVARLRIAGFTPADPRARELAAAIVRRRTDRRAFDGRPVPGRVLTALRRSVEARGCHLYEVAADEVPLLAAVTARAAAEQRANVAYRAELDRWTHRPAQAGDGVPATTAVRQSPRRVPVRDFTPGGVPGLEPGPGHDAGAAYVVLFGADDDPASWLRAGEALSELLLSATAAGLSTAPLSEAVEVAWPRRVLSGLLSGAGHPYLVVRMGHVGPGAAPLPSAPRRSATEVIDYAERVAR